MPSVLWTSLRSHSPHGNLLLVGLHPRHRPVSSAYVSRFLLVAGLFMLPTPGSQIWTLGPWRRLGPVHRSCHGLYASSSMALTTGRSVLKGAGLQSHGKLILCNRPPAARRHMMVCCPSGAPRLDRARVAVRQTLCQGAGPAIYHVRQDDLFVADELFYCAVWNPTSGASGRLLVTSLSGPSLRCFVNFSTWTVWSGYATAFGCIRVRLRTSRWLHCPKPLLVWPSLFMPIRCLAWTVSTRSARLFVAATGRGPPLALPKVAGRSTTLQPHKVISRKRKADVPAQTLHTFFRRITRK